MRKNAIVIQSYNDYYDLWSVCLDSLSSNMDLKDFDVYITTDDSRGVKLEYDAKFITYSKLSTWGQALIETVQYLVSCKYEKIIFTFDDLIINNKIDVNKLLSLDLDNKDYIKLTKSHVRFYERFSFNQSSVFRIDKNDSYGGSLVFCIVNIKFLNALLGNDELNQYNPWDYEKNINSYLVGKKIKMWACRFPLILYVNLIIKGKVDPLALFRIKYQGFTYLSDRRVMSNVDISKYYFKWLIFTIIKYFSPFTIFKFFRKIKGYF